VNYREINREEDIKDLIKEMRVKYKNLSQIFPANEYETTMGGKKVVMLYYRLEPAFKVEAEEDLMNQFVTQFKHEVKGYSSG